MNNTETAHNDTTPSVLEQCAQSQWQAGLYNFGAGIFKGAQTFMNPGLVRRPDGLWLLVRRSENEPGNPIGINDIWAVKLDETGRVPLHGHRLHWKGKEDRQQFEDARAFYVPHLDQVGVSAATFRWDHRSWTGAIQVLGFFDRDWNCKVMHYVPFSTNARSLRKVAPEHYQKNWLFWMGNDRKLSLLYKSNPWITAQFGHGWSHVQAYKSEGVTWPHGEIRGGTPPLLIGNRYITFFHSSEPWHGRLRRYYMGASAFEAQAPYKPLAVTRDPLLVGSSRDVWAQNKPACIFPTGAVIQGDKFFIVAGINDMACAWMEIPISDVLQRLTTIGLQAPSEIEVEETPPLPPPQPDAPTQPPKPPKKAPPKPSEPEEQRKAMMRARMAKVRAARGGSKRVAEMKA